MGRWLSVVDPSSTTGRCGVEKNCQRGHCERASYLSSQMSGGRVGVELEDFRVGGLRCKKRAPRHFWLNGNDYKRITDSEKTMRSRTDAGDG